MRDIEREFIDIRNDKIEETMFTKDDMLEYSDFLASAIKVRVLNSRVRPYATLSAILDMSLSMQTHVAADIGAIINMGALAVNQLLVSSQDKGVELTLETAPLENQVR